MQPSDVSRAVASARASAAALGLAIDDAVVLQNSNKLIVRLLPCDTVARIAPTGQHVAQFEVELAARLAMAGSPAVVPDPRVPLGVYERDGFAVTFWTHHAPVAAAMTSAKYADALRRLHIGMQDIDLAAPHFMDRVAEARHLLTTPERTPELPQTDRVFLSRMLHDLKSSIASRGGTEQLLHGEPHPGNVLNTAQGPLFIDLETCCRGPVEFDIAHAPEDVSGHYPGLDQALLADCRALVLVMVAAWRWDGDDQFPNGRMWGEQFIRTLRKGAPWPSLQAMERELADRGAVAG